MKPLSIAAVLLALATVASAHEQPQTTTTPPPEVSVIPPDVPQPESQNPSIFADEAPVVEPVPEPPKHVDSPLVKAAKANGTRKKSARKVITNADVKKARAKLIVTNPAPLPVAASQKGSIQLQDDRLRARDADDAKVVAAGKKVAELEKELHRVEQTFYDENDATYRDDVIRKRFDQINSQLEAARKALADARDERARMEIP